MKHSFKVGDRVHVKLPSKKKLTLIDATRTTYNIEIYKLNNCL